MATAALTGTASAFAYHRQSGLDWRLTLVAETARMPGIISMILLTSFASPSLLKALFSIFFISLAISIVLRKESLPDGDISTEGLGRARRKKVLRNARGEVFSYFVDLSRFLPASFFTGVISGFFGVGGGSVKDPGDHHMGMPMHVDIATSTLMIALTALSGMLGHLILNHIRLIELLALAPGVIAGAQLGTSATRRARSPVLRRSSLVLMIIAIILLAR